MSDPDLRAAFALAATAGAYFEVAYSGGEPDEPVGEGWRPLREFVQDARVVDERVAVARAFLAERTRGEVELRACASINSLGMLSRLVSPALATAALAGVVPRLGADDVYWQPVDGGPVPIAVHTDAGGTVATPDDAATAIVDLVIEPVVRPVLERYRDRFRLSPQTLWGNVASALAGASGMLRRSGLPLRLDPDDVVAALLARGPVAGAGRYDRPFTDPGQRFFVRTNCCLFYRIPAGGKCGDCVLVPEPARHALWRDALERDA